MFSIVFGLQYQNQPIYWSYRTLDMYLKFSAADVRSVLKTVKYCMIVCPCQTVLDMLMMVVFCSSRDTARIGVMPMLF